MNPDTLEIMLANETKQEYPEYGENGKFLTLKVKDGTVFVVGLKLGETSLFTDDGKLNPRISKTDMKTLGPHRTELIQQKDEEIKELDNTIQEDTRAVNGENEEPSVRERAREKITENTERKTQLENEREQLVESLPLRERAKVSSKKTWLDTSSGCSGCWLSHRCYITLFHKYHESCHKDCW